MNNAPQFDKFVNRHTGLRDSDISEMLKAVGANSLEILIDETIPQSIRFRESINIDSEISEYEFLNYIRNVAQKNVIAKSYIGMGYNTTIVPPVIQRNVLENPGWYTQYTPYQAEISQGRLEALLNFQTMICDLTGLPIANASLLDEATAAAEAMQLFYSYSRSHSKNGNKFLVASDVFPQTIDVIKTRSHPLGIVVDVQDTAVIKLSRDYFGILLQYPNGNGEINNYHEIIAEAKANNILVVFAADILSLALLTPPGEFGADVCVGSTQRFGVPMGFGGPHAAYFAVKDEFKRIIPGRIIGASVDVHGNLAYRMALQTREQHIKREKATSNICTSQVLLAIMASMYALYHGPEGLKNIASRIHKLAKVLEIGLTKAGFTQKNTSYFDTLLIDIHTAELYAAIKKAAALNKLNFRYTDDNLIGISINEATTLQDVQDIVSLFVSANAAENSNRDFNLEFIENETIQRIPTNSIRQSPYLTNKVFNRYHSETEMMRYLKKLEMKDLSLTASMIPLGSCTMKLNAASEMYAISFPEFGNIHPFAPKNQVSGYMEIIEKLASYLSAITGFPGVSLQPNSGAQGEYSGLLVIREYFAAHNQSNRNVVLIPSSAHGTNPASAVMAGMKIQVVNCDVNGNIDVADLKKKAEQFSADLAGLMVTYPSTHGVYEEAIQEICSIIHANGGQVYMDGANMNAQVALTKPAIIGADVCHINLHKTFAIPHGGGGPGMGPICCAQHLIPFLPGHSVISISDSESSGAVSAAPFGSANILIISLAYIMMLGEEGLKKATQIAILNANYLKAKLESDYKVLYTGAHQRVAHELIFDCRDFKRSAGVEVEDIAKRLMDYGFHAPTVSFPVPGTLMVEPTESESKYELDRFIEAMISIRKEIAEIEAGNMNPQDNVLKNAPHTSVFVTCEEWNHPYSREKAAFPVPSLKQFKFWPSVGRINNAYGDRNLICSCNEITDYITE